MGPKYIDSAMTGKSYAKAVHAHRFTLQVLWQLLLPEPLEFSDGTELKGYLMSQKTLITWLLQPSRK